MSEPYNKAKDSVLFINRVYLPDEASTGQILAELAVELVQQGWQVTIICSHTVKTAPCREIINGVEVLRVSSLPFSRASNLKRALSYLSLYPALLWRALRQPKYDVVVTMTDPPLQLLLGLPIRWLRGSYLLHWAQDIYPELAEQLGVIRPRGILANLLRWFSNTALQRYDKIVVIGRCMQQRFIERGISSAKLEFIPNWADTDLIFPIKRENNSFLRKHSISIDAKLVVYSGNMGMAHPFESIVEVMIKLQNSMPDVLFLFIGAGVRQDWLKSQVKLHNLSNIRFFPYQDKEQLAHSLSIADIHLACMQDDLCGLVVPSKAYGIMAAGRPLFYIGPVNSEVALLVEELHCGQIFTENEVNKLIDTIHTWLFDIFNSKQQNTAGLRGREFAEQHAVQQAANKFAKVFSILKE
ncbi:MAG: glycosyltransferase family 4 protein [Mariprofundales bacterium]